VQELGAEKGTKERQGREMRKPGPTAQVAIRKQLSAEGAACGKFLPSCRAFSAQINLCAIDPGALPLAITFHAFSVKNAGAL